MEQNNFHGTKICSMEQTCVPWNKIISIEQFHGTAKIPWNKFVPWNNFSVIHNSQTECPTTKQLKSYIKQAIRGRIERHPCQSISKVFHGTWNVPCSSMEFHGIPWNNSMEFHGTGVFLN